MIEYTKDQASIVKAIKAVMGKDKAAQAATLGGQAWRVRAQVDGLPLHAEIHTRADVPPLTDLPLAVNAGGLRTAGVVVPTSVHLDDVQVLSADLREDRRGDKPAAAAGLLDTATLRRALTHSSDDMLRGYLHGVAVRAVGDRRFVAASDGHRGLMLPAPDMTAGPYIPGQLARAMVAMAKVAGKAGDSIQWTIATSKRTQDAAETRVCVVAEVPTVGTVYMSQIEAWRFPQIENVYPTDTVAAWIDAPAAAALREMLTRAGKMHRANGSKYYAVHLTLDGSAMAVAVPHVENDPVHIGSINAPGVAVGRLGVNAAYLLEALDAVGDAGGVTLRFSALRRPEPDGDNQTADPDGTTIDDVAPVVVTAGAHVDMAGGSIPAGGSVVVMPMRI